MKFKLFFAWYDFWVGWYYDRKRKILYINPLPMVVFSFASEHNYWIGDRWEHLSEILARKGEPRYRPFRRRPRSKILNKSSSKAEEP